jgi:hypothetical protein
MEMSSYIIIEGMQEVFSSFVSLSPRCVILAPVDIGAFDSIGNAFCKLLSAVTSVVPLYCVG